MSGRLRIIAAIVLLALLGVAPRLTAQSGDEIATLGCKHGVRDELRRQQADADVVFTSARTQRSGKDVSVTGGGTFTSSARRHGRAFTYDCLYRPRSGRVRVNVQVDSTGAAP